MGRVFSTPKLTGPERRENLDAWVSRYPRRFRSREDAHDWLKQLHTPASQRWVFCNNGKTGTSSTKRFLFHMEHGVPLTVHLEVTNDINSDVVAHRLAEFGVFRNLGDIADSVSIYRKALRIMSVRNPFQRAVSAFLYLCKSDDLARGWFAADRARMNAVTGFNWNTDPRTVTGFEKFLDYVAFDIETRGPFAVNGHWRPQVANTRPNLFKPDIIGKTEALADFFKEIAARLEEPFPREGGFQQTNRNEDMTNRAALLTPSVRDRIKKIYEQDFTTFGYDT